MRQMDSIWEISYRGRNGHEYSIKNPTVEDIRKMLVKCSARRRNMRYRTESGVRGLIHRNDNGVGISPFDYCDMSFFKDVGFRIVADDYIPRMLITYGRSSDGRRIIRAREGCEGCVGYVEVGVWC